MSSGLFGQALCRLPSKCVGQGRSVKCLKNLRTSAASRLSTQEPEAKQHEQLPYFKTQVTCPLKHDQRHLGRIYTVSNLTSSKNFLHSVFARFKRTKTKSEHKLDKCRYINKRGLCMRLRLFFAKYIQVLAKKGETS